jgi:hypothetical protein
MAWYDKYYNKIAKNDNFWLEIKTEKLFEAASKATHPARSNSVRWYEYYYDEDSDKYIRITKKLETVENLSGYPKKMLSIYILNISSRRKYA